MHDPMAVPVATSHHIGGGLLIVFDALNGGVIRQAWGHKSAVQGIAWSPDGRRLASGGRDHTVKIWDVAVGHKFEELLALRGHNGSVLCVAWHPDGTRLLSAATDSVRIWDAPGYTPAGGGGSPPDR